MMRLFCIFAIVLLGTLNARGGQNVPHADITPVRKPHKVDIIPKPGKDSPRALPQQEGIYLSADFLMWQFRLDGLDYAFLGFDDSSENAARGGVRYVSNRWRPGLKVGIGTHLPRDSWRISAEYTYYQNHEASNITNPDIFPTWNIAHNFSDFNITNGLVTSAGADLRFQYNTVNFSLLRSAFISDYLRMEPFVGFKAAWLKENYTVNYIHQFSEIFAEELSMENNISLYGLGLRSGTNWQWSFDQMISFVGNGAFSILWSRFDTTRRDTSQIVPTSLSEELVNLDTQYSYFTLVPVFEFELGPKFEWWLYKDVYHFEILGMWEIQYWMNQSQFIQLVPERPFGDLAVTGFTLRMRLDF